MSSFGVSLLLVVVYTYVGYPLLIALWAKLSPRAVQMRSGFEPRVSVCLVVYNGAQYLPAKIASLRALDYPPSLLEILIYCDGSSDGSADVARELAGRDARLQVFEGPERRGKPTGLSISSFF